MLIECTENFSIIDKNIDIVKKFLALRVRYSFYIYISFLFFLFCFIFLYNFSSSPSIFFLHFFLCLDYSTRIVTIIVVSHEGWHKFMCKKKKQKNPLNKSGIFFPCKNISMPKKIVILRD